MQLLLNWIPIIMFLRVITRSYELKDLTDSCVKGRVFNTYLTTGMGSTDAHVSFVAGVEELNCSLRYSSAANIIAVVQFPDRRPSDYICSEAQNSVLMVSRNSSKSVCENVRNPRKIHYMLAKNELTVRILSNGALNTVKVTATSLREPETPYCSPNEVECNVDRKTYCMPQSFRCDGHTNCGMEDQSDEYSGDCKDSVLTPTQIIVSIVTGLFIFLLSLSLIMVLVPKRKETFVYKFDESTTLFDVEDDYIHIELNIQIVFPVDAKK